MIKMLINNLEMQAEEGSTILDTCKFYGLEIPTICHNEGLSNYGACRLCLVEIGAGENTKLVSSCTYPAQEGLVVHTDTRRVLEARKMMIELMLSTAPGSKILQDMAAKMGVKQQRFELRNEECIYCGLCVRMCAEQMDARAIGFQNRGYRRKISTPFDVKSKECRLCGACMYICPVCALRCQGPDADTAICSGCLDMDPTCVDVYDELQCWMYDHGQCGTCVRKPSDVADDIEKPKEKNA